AAPSHAVRQVMTQARGKVGRGALVVSVSKGLEPERLSTPSCVLADVLPKETPIAVLSGPSFAREVYARQPTAVVAAAREHTVAQPPTGGRARRRKTPRGRVGGAGCGRRRGEHRPLRGDARGATRRRAADRARGGRGPLQPQIAQPGRLRLDGTRAQTGALAM